MLEDLPSRLPPEVLGKILSQAVGRIELHLPRHDTRLSSESDLPASSLPHNPWVLALVCRDWWDAIISTPYIWSDISLEFIPDEELRSHNYDALLSAWKLCLDRSHNCSLTIKLTICYKPAPDQVRVFLKLLMEHAQQWETVTFEGLFDEIVLPDLSSYPVQYTRLRRLCINSYFGGSQERYTGLFQDAPLLSCISLDWTSYYGKRIGGVGIPWAQISHLKLSASSFFSDDPIYVLKYTSNLITLDYDIGHNYFRQAQGLLTLELPHLQQVSWLSADNTRDKLNDTSTSLFFQMLKAPQLSVLRVRGHCEDMEMEAIRGCLQRSGCSITCLEFPTPLVSPLLSLLPDVKTLELKDNVKLHDISFGASPPYIFELPHLEQIDYHVDSLAAPGSRTMSQFFGLVKAPELSALVVNDVCGSGGMKAICDCLQRSKCSIKLLKVPARYTLPLRSLTPDVETLVLPYLFDDADTMSLFRELTFDHSASSWLFPKLKKIALARNIPAALFDAFIGMLKSRLQAPPKSLVEPECNKLRELELGDSFPKRMRHRIQGGLTPQASLLITCAAPRRQPDQWDFCK